MADQNDPSALVPPKPDEDWASYISQLYGQDYEAVDRKHVEMDDDLAFYAGDQWDKEIKRDRDAQLRPCLTIDNIAPVVRQVTGDMRMNRPAIKVRAADGDATKDVAEILEGLIRNIETQSRATQTVYVKGGENSAICGQGAWRIVTEYADDDVFEQDIRLKPINSATAVVWDRNAEEITREDAQHCYVLNRFSLEAFRAKYPEASTESFETNETTTTFNQWWDGEYVLVAEFWYKEPRSRTLWRMGDGAVIEVTDFKEPERAEIVARHQRTYEASGQPAPPILERQVESFKVKRRVCNGVEELEEPADWPGRYIPIIPVFGEEIHVRNGIYRRGMVRQAKDPQRMVNYHASASVEHVALSPKQPFIGTAKQFEGYEDQWSTSNKENAPYLTYNNDPAAPGPPKRQPMPEMPAALLALKQQGISDLHNAVGVIPASFETAENEASGVAIRQRQSKGDVGSFVYVDNLAIAISYTGEQLVDLIPKVYDTDRMVRILGEDDVEKLVRVNEGLNEQRTTLNDLSLGKYDVVVTTGPSFSSRRQEGADFLNRFVGSAPQAAEMVMDKLFEALDVPGNDEIAERFRKRLIAAGVIEPDPERGEQAPPQPQAPPDLLGEAALRGARAREMDAQTRAIKASADIEAKAYDVADKRAEVINTMADTGKKMAEAEGQRIENVAQAMELVLESDQFRGMLRAVVDAAVAAQAAQRPVIPNGSG